MTKDQVRSTEEALKLALEALEEPHPGIRTSFTDAIMYRERVKQAITALQEALAEQPAQQEEHDLSMREPSAIRDRLIQAGWTPPAQQPTQTDWEAVAADQAMTIALLKAELQEFAEKQADSVEVALTESGWVWDGDQWQRPPQTWIELDHDDIHALLNEFFYKGMQPSGVHFANFARAIEAKLKEKNT